MTKPTVDILDQAGVEVTVGKQSIKKISSDSLQRSNSCNSRQTHRRRPEARCRRKAHQGHLSRRQRRRCARQGTRKGRSRHLADSVYLPRPGHQGRYPHKEECRDDVVCFPRYEGAGGRGQKGWYYGHERDWFGSCECFAFFLHFELVVNVYDTRVWTTCTPSKQSQRSTMPEARSSRSCPTAVVFHPPRTRTTRSDTSSPGLAEVSCSPLETTPSTTRTAPSSA